MIFICQYYEKVGKESDENKTTSSYEAKIKFIKYINIEKIKGCFLLYLHSCFFNSILPKIPKIFFILLMFSILE